MNNNVLIYVVLVILSLFVLGGMFWTTTRLPRVIERVDTIEKVEFKWKDTIVKDTVFQPKYIKVLKRDTVVKENGDTMELVRTQETYQKSIVSDKDTANLTLYISGVETSLDSLKMRFKTHTEYITNTVIKTVEREKTFKDRFHIGLQLGYGIGLKDKEFQPFIGVGASFDF